MKLKEIYQLAISLGKSHDIRGDEIQLLLEKELADFEKLSEDERRFYDTESLHNPYSDSRILVGSGEEEITAIMAGIDIETPEVLLADRLRQKGHRIDLLLAHHPEGIAQAALHDVMHIQADMMEIAGVPINVGEGIMASRISEMQRGMMPLNHQRAVDASRLLDLPFLCVHSPADILVSNFLQDLINRSSYRTVGDIINILLTLPEYQKASQLKAGPRIVTGDKNRRAGKVFIKMSGGTAGAEKAYEKLAAAGVGTYICMHIPDKHRQAARENNINVIVAGHMASDSLGMNLFLDELQSRGINIIPCSGLIRVSRLAQHDFH